MVPAEVFVDKVECPVTPTQRSHDASTKDDSLFKENKSDPDPDPPLIQALSCAVGILAMFDDMSQANTTDTAIRESCNVLGHHLQDFYTSFSTHFAIHPITGPIDGQKHSLYYVSTTLGKYIRRVLSAALHATVLPEEEGQATLPGVLSTYRQFGYDIPNHMSNDELSVRSREYAWWLEQNKQPGDAEVHEFFQDLRFSGLVHLPQVAHCTCVQSFSMLYRSAIRLCLKLRFGAFDYSFSKTDRLKAAFDLRTGKSVTTNLTTVIPALRIKRRGELWSEVFPGFGVSVQSNDLDPSGGGKL